MSAVCSACGVGFSAYKAWLHVYKCDTCGNITILDPDETSSASTKGTGFFDDRALVVGIVKVVLAIAAIGAIVWLLSKV